MRTKTKDMLRNLFCVIAIAALWVTALSIIFQYGPPNDGLIQATTNPQYYSEPWYETLWRFGLGAILIGSSFAVVFTMIELSQEKESLSCVMREINQHTYSGNNLSDTSLDN